MHRYHQVNDKKTSRSVIFVAIILIALATAAWFYTQHQQDSAVSRPETQTLEIPSAPQAVDPVPKEAGTDTMVELQPQDSPFVLPDLQHSDALFRDAVTGISPPLAEWLSTDQLIRKYVVMANDFSQGLRLEKHLRFLKLEQPFAVDQDNQSQFIATESYRRYDRLAAAINEMDVSATLAVYKKFRPLLLQVFNEFSYPPEYGLEDVFAKAAAVILNAPTQDGKVAVVKHAIYYKFADPQLEASNPVHKQMLRMGPENTRIIQNKLRLLVEGLVNQREH